MGARKLLKPELWNESTPVGALPTQDELGEVAKWAATLAVRNRFIGKIAPFDRDDISQEVAILTIRKIKRAEFRHGGKRPLKEFAYFAACCCLSNYMNARSAGRLWMKEHDANNSQRRLCDACMNYLEKENETALRRVAAAIFAIAKERGHDAYECETLSLDNLQGAFE